MTGTLPVVPAASSGGRTVGRCLLDRSLRPLNAETPPEQLSRADVTPSDLFFIRTHGPVPRMDPHAYRLSVTGDLRNPLLLGLTELRRRFVRTSVAATVACAGNRRSELRPPRPGIPWGPGAVGTAVWGGVRLRDLLKAVGPAADARHVAFTGADTAGGERFAGSIPIEKAMSGEVLLADEMNGAALSAEHGYPLRVVVPGYIGARSVKWLSAISVQRESSASPFQRTDYAVRGIPLDEQPVTSAICRPSPHAVVGSEVAVEGYALGSGGRPIREVEVSADGGLTWASAHVDVAAPPWTWRLWQADLCLCPGVHELVVRATDEAGATQPDAWDATGNPRGYLNNAWHRVRVLSVEDAVAGDASVAGRRRQR